MKKEYQAWEDNNGITFADVAQINGMREQGIFNLFGEPKLLHTVIADTPEEATSVHHIKMGWEPYKPMGEPAQCPRGCGAHYYPEGSGICPNCGLIG